MVRNGRENRQFERLRWRVPCSFAIKGRERRGFVTDLSARGMFIHTSEPLEPGHEILVTLDTDEYPPMTLQGTVVRRKSVNRNAIMVETGHGMGVRLLAAPEEYYRLVAQLSSRKKVAD